MKPRTIATLLALLCATSCDKAKDFAQQASSTVKEQIVSRIGNEDDPADPALQKLVDETPEGVVFRKDLRFPARLTVRTTRRQKWSGRLHQLSAIEQRNENLEGTRLTITRLERAGDEVRHTLEQTGFTIPSPDDPEGAEKTLSDPFSSISPANSSQTFRKGGGTWKADADGGFRAATLVRDLAPVMDQLLVENALAPRPLWFSAKKRFKAGDELVLTGDSLPMLLAGNPSGSLTLKFESTTAVSGHPCGVFSVSGHFRRNEFPDFDGSFTDEDITIQSGKLWLSLIHPVILREELDTIQTLKSGPRGAQNLRSQGTIKVSVTREWKALEQ